MAGLFGPGSRTAGVLRGAQTGVDSDDTEELTNAALAPVSVTRTFLGDAASRGVRQTLGRLPKIDWPQQSEVSPEPFPLPRSPKTEPVRNRLQQLYGPNGEYLDESYSTMQQTLGGQERLKLWAQTIKDDSSYKPRYEELKKRFGDSHEAFWIQAIGEYREERKKDAEIGGVSAAVDAAWDTAMFTPPALAFRTARAAGAPVKTALQTALVSETIDPAMMAGRAIRAPLRAIASRPRRLLIPGIGAGVGGALTGDMEGAATGAVATLPFTSAHGAATLLRGSRSGLDDFADLVKNWGRPKGSKMAITPEMLGLGRGKVTPTMGNFLEAYPKADPTFGMRPEYLTGALAALYGGIEAGPGGAVAGGFGGLAAGKLVKRLPGTTIGAVGGGAIGASLNEEDPVGGAFMGVFMGIPTTLAGKKAVQGAASTRAIFEGGDALLGDLTPWGWFMSHVVPEADLRRIRVFADMLYPVLDEADKGFDLATRKMREDIIESVGGAQVFTDEKRMARITALSRRLGRAVDPDTKAPLNSRIRNLGLPADASLDDVKAAVGMRKVIDGWFDEAVQTGAMTPEQYIQGYIPRVLDEEALWKQLPKGLKNRGDIRALDRRLRELMPKLSQFEADDAIDIFVNDPMKFLKLLEDGDLIDPKLAKEILGGDDMMRKLQQIVELAAEKKVRPTTLMHILRGPAKRGDAGIMLGGRIKNDWIPKALLDEFGLSRTKADLDVIEHMPTVIDRYIRRTQRARYYDPLVRAWNSAVEEGVEALPELSDPRLLKLHNALKKNNADRLSDVARKLINSRLGVPAASDILVEDALAYFPKLTPASGQAAARIFLDMQYSGALGFNVGASTRNLFQNLISATAMTPTDFAMGMREVARQPDVYEALLPKYASVLDPSDEAFAVAKIGGTTPFRRGWNRYVEAAFEMFHAADYRNRLWTFAAGYRRAMIDQVDIAKVGEAHKSLQAFRPDQRQRFARLAETADPKEFAGQVGGAMSDLTQWVYGKRGSPLAVRSMIGANLGIFSTWPANYMSLMYEWAANGRIGHIMNIGLATAVLERVANEGGVGRLTGFTAELPGPAQILPVGPMQGGLPILGSPLAQMPGEAAHLGASLFEAGVGAGESRDFRPYHYKASLLGGRPIQRYVDAATAEDPEVAARKLLGVSRPQEDRR